MGLPHALHAEQLLRPGDRGGAVFHVEFLVDMLQVFAHRRRSEPEDGGNVPVRPALGNPEEDFGLPAGEADKTGEICRGGEGTLFRVPVAPAGRIHRQVPVRGDPGGTVLL